MQVLFKHSLTLLVTMPHLVVTEALLWNIFTRVLRIVHNYVTRHLVFYSYFFNTSLIPFTKFRPPYLVKTTAATRTALPHTHQHVQYFRVSKQWYSCQLFGICRVHAHFKHMRLSCYVPYQITPKGRVFHLADKQTLKRHILSYPQNHRLQKSPGRLSPKSSVSKNPQVGGWLGGLGGGSGLGGRYLAHGLVFYVLCPFLFCFCYQSDFKLS